MMRAVTPGFIAGLLTVAASPHPTNADDVLATLRKEHPRLYLLDGDLPALKKRVESNPTAKAWHAKLKRDAEASLTQPPMKYLKPTGPVKPGDVPLRMPGVFSVQERVSTLALLYRVDGDRRWLDRARKEMLAIASFPDWNPGAHLDTATLTHTLAIGYDWLHKDLSETDRTTIRKALVEKGLKPTLKDYRENGWWVTTDHNHNQVGNCGPTVGALAIADEEPDLARQVIEAGRASIALAMKSFAPDGGWVEGPMLWCYGGRSNCQYLHALSTALGTDFGLKASPGFSETDRFWPHLRGPSGLMFNYADNLETAPSGSPQMFASPHMLWLAREFRHTWAAAREANAAESQVSAFHLIWSDALETAKPDPNFPTDALFRGTEVAFFRSAWDDPKAVYVGFKCGDNMGDYIAKHTHLDLGSFVLDAGGQRWAVDLGMDSFKLDQYFGTKRWKYFRCNTQSHNTLTIDGKNQDPMAKAPIVAFRSGPSRSFAVTDLTKAYATQVSVARRGIALLDRRRVLVQDELTPSAPSEVTWKMLTRAKVRLDGSSATLEQGGAALTMRVLEPSGAKFETQDASAPPPQDTNKDVSALVVKVAAQAKPTRIVVLLEPGSRPAAAPKIEPLDQWVAEGKLPGSDER